MSNYTTVAKSVGCGNFLNDESCVEEVKENLVNNEPFNLSVSL